MIREFIMRADERIFAAAELGFRSNPQDFVGNALSDIRQYAPGLQRFIALSSGRYASEAFPLGIVLTLVAFIGFACESGKEEELLAQLRAVDAEFYERHGMSYCKDTTGFKRRALEMVVVDESGGALVNFLDRFSTKMAMFDQGSYAILELLLRLEDESRGIINACHLN